MEGNNPKIRSELDIRPESPDAGSSVVVKDLVTRRFYRFTAIQAGVLAQLDGSHDAASIAASVSRSFNAEVTRGQVEDFTGKLRCLLLLDHPACWEKLDAARVRRYRWLSNILSIKIHAFNPDRLLTTLSTKLCFCFGRTFALVVWTAVATAFVISVLNWNSLFVSMGTLVSLYSLPLLFIVASVVLTIHEFAHGLTLKHFGGKVEEMGFLVLYFIPAFYCNLSDAWLLRKRERLLVTLSGGYIQLFIWACATIAWRLLAPEIFLSRICLVVIAFSGLQTLLNFNPLIKLDGYYLLSDFLEIPNLRAKAWRFLWCDIVRGRLLGIKGAGLPAAGQREKRTYAVYGSASFLFSAGLLAFTLQRLGGWLVDELQTWGMFLMATLLFAAVPAARGETVGAGTALASGAAAKLGKLPRWTVLLCVAIVGGCLPWELKIPGEFVIHPERRVSVSPEVDGMLKSIKVEEGERVEAGDVLAEMENLELSNSYEDTRGQLAALQATLEQLKAGTRLEEIDRARKLVETKKAELATAGKIQEQVKELEETVAKKQVEVLNAGANFQRTEKLLKDGLISKNDAERDETTYAVKVKELSEAKGQLKVLEERTESTKTVKVKELAQADSELRILLAGTRKETIQATEAAVVKLVEMKRNLEQQLECLKIRSPIRGLIATPRLRNRVGQYLNKGDFFCDIVSEGTVTLDMSVPEKEIADVHSELPIMIKVRGYPNLSFQAKVKSIAPIAVEQGNERMVIVKGELDNQGGILKAGMTGVGKIFCGKRFVAQLVTRRLWRWLRTEFWEYLP